MKLTNIIKQAFCPHLYNDQIFIKNLHGDEINTLNARSVWQCKRCGTLIYSNEVYDTNNISDGYHTFGELYHHRAILTAALCHTLSIIYGDNICWKSWKHSDDTMYDDMFIVGIETPKGTATYHYNRVYWKLFDVKELEKAPKWDGHNADDAIDRIKSLISEPKPNVWRLSKEEFDNLVKLQQEMLNPVHNKKKTIKKSKKSLLDKIFNLF